ncbi:MAG: efflux RND transporter periplasmic adaptor subunit [Pseudomonadota bacterium]|nr:efflux RND transporter periplasmic adaptor subunit [Pseudomonadota bacterium]
MNNRLHRPLVLSIFLVVTLAACDRQADAPVEQAKVEAPKVQAPAAPPAPLVVTAEAEIRSIQPGFEYPALIEAVETAATRPQVAGAVKKRSITPGALVKKGDLLVELDDADYQVRIAEVEAAIAQAKAGAAEADANFERAKKLKPKGYISLKDFDAAKARSISAMAQIEQAEAKLQRARLDLEHTKIYAPFGGKISAANYAVGDYVAPTSPRPLFELVKLDPVYAIASVNMKLYENFVLKRAKLKEQGKEIPPLELGIRLSNGQEFAHKGSFENWDNIATGSSGTIAGRALFPNPEGLLLPGHSVTLIGRVITAIERVMVPQKAVSQDQQGYYVLKADADNVAQRQNIEVGIRDGVDWTVMSGLDAGDRVIVEGLQKVRPGMKVEVKAGNNEQ